METECREVEYAAGQAPKAETETVVAQGKGAKYSFSGVSADGSSIAFSYTTNYDGKDSPVSGTGPFGQDTIARKRVDANTTISTSKRGGKVVATMKTVISEDGKVMTVSSQGIGADGKPRNVVSVWEKQ